MVSLIWVSFVTWVAKLQSPFLHLTLGSGQTVQYHPEANSEARLHPWHSSTIWWQSPPLKEQPLLVIKMHSTPSFTLVQTIGITPFHFVSFEDFANRKQKSWRTYQPLLGLSTRFWATHGNGVLPGCLWAVLFQGRCFGKSVLVVLQVESLLNGRFFA